MQRRDDADAKIDHRPVAAIEDPTAIGGSALFGRVHRGAGLDVRDASAGLLVWQNRQHAHHAQVLGQHGHMLFIGREKQIAGAQLNRMTDQRRRGQFGRDLRHVNHGSIRQSRDEIFRGISKGQRGNHVLHPLKCIRG